MKLRKATLAALLTLVVFCVTSVSAASSAPSVNTPKKITLSVTSLIVTSGSRASQPITFKTNFSYSLIRSGPTPAKATLPATPNPQWRSSDPKVATVSQDGKVAGGSVGTAVLTLSIEASTALIVEAQCSVTVVPQFANFQYQTIIPPPMGAPVGTPPTQSSPVAITANQTLQFTDWDVHVKQQLKFAITATASGGDKGVLWTSSTPSVASIDAKGIVTLKGLGTTTIMVTTKYGAPKATCFISVTKEIPKWPLPTGSWVSSRFRTQERPNHQGIDIVAPDETAISAPKSGLVIFAGLKDPSGPEGKARVIILQHADGSTTEYWHLSKFEPGIEVGKTIFRQGKTIGYVGHTGDVWCSHGVTPCPNPHKHAHLHFKVTNDAGTVINPLDWVKPGN